ncbi:MAG: ergothioneine biosynthesis protein EgtB [Cyclobacteriaceae bacterium]
MKTETTITPTIDTKEVDHWSLLQETRQYTEHLCVNLEIEDYGLQASEFVSPVKWHLAHTSWFFETFLLIPLLKDYKPFHPKFNFFFNSYYEAIGQRTQRAERGQLSRPTVKQVYAYRAHVDEHLALLLDLPDRDWLDTLMLGIQHEKQHQELIITDLKYCLGLNPVFPAVFDLHEQNKLHTTEDQYLTMQSGKYKIGYEGSGFSFDNEKDAHEVYLQPFEIAKQPVTNQSFLNFIQDDGYKRTEFWHQEGWQWINDNHIGHPLHWHKIEGTWHFYTLNGLQSLSLNTPAMHINYYEASAYAEWAGATLPTEFEWEAASPFFDFGTVWEWTQSAYLPYPNFQKAPGAIGEYNGKFMVNQMVLRGGSLASPQNHVRPTYRNFFHPQMNWQFSGFRLKKKHQ